MNAKRFVAIACVGLALAAVVGCAAGGSAGQWSALQAQVDAVERDRLGSGGGMGDEAGGATWFRLASDQLASPQSANQAVRAAGLSFAGLVDEDQTDQPAEPAGEPVAGHERRGPLPSFWETVKRDVREAPGDLWADTKAVYTSGSNLAILGLAYGGSLAIQETGPDGTVEDSFNDGHRTFGDDWRDAFGAAGNPGTHFALAGLWYVVGQQTQDDKTYEVGKTLFSALIINSLSTMVGKAATWDDSPNGEWGSFPSGHTSSAFTFASVMHEAYGPWVGAPLYALSALVGYERLESGEHYLSDVIMGGVMGLVIGHTVAGDREFELFGGEIQPYVDPYNGSSGIAWVKHFK